MSLPFIDVRGARPWPPRVSAFTKPFWDALAQGRLITTRGKVMTTTLQEDSGLPGSAANDLPAGPPGFLAAYPGYQGTALLDELRATEYSYLDAGRHTYLDYTGAGLPAQAQLAAHAERIRSGCFGNPHSDSPASTASTAATQCNVACTLRPSGALPPLVAGS